MYIYFNIIISSAAGLGITVEGKMASESGDGEAALIQFDAVDFTGPMNFKSKRVDTIFRDAKNTDKEDHLAGHESDDEDYIETAEERYKDSGGDGNDEDDDSDEDEDVEEEEVPNEEEEEIEAGNEKLSGAGSRRKAFALELAREVSTLFPTFGSLLPLKLCMNCYDPMVANEFLELKFKGKARVRRLQHYIPDFR